MHEKQKKKLGQENLKINTVVLFRLDWFSIGGHIRLSEEQNNHKYDSLKILLKWIIYSGVEPPR